MKYSVDRIENDKIIVQNLETLQMEEISKDKIPFSVRDGDILKLENNTYQLDEAEKEKRKKRIQEKQLNYSKKKLYIIQLPKQEEEKNLQKYILI